MKSIEVADGFIPFPFIPMVFTIWIITLMSAFFILAKLFLELLIPRTLLQQLFTINLGLFIFNILPLGFTDEERF